MYPISTPAGGDRLWEILWENCAGSKGKRQRGRGFEIYSSGRNKFIYDNSFLHFSSVVSTALSMQSDFKKAQLLESSSQDTPRVLIWKPPPQGSLKMNVDGATLGEIDKAGIGLVLRDHEGNVLMACSKIEHAVQALNY
ncbi:hypothetical protein I3760_09G128000 [Carya illinoinensis]|nr:hypothetical protein I3760_09G128000 [Carya illinoinensis]